MVNAQQLLDKETSYEELGIREVGQEAQKKKLKRLISDKTLEKFERVGEKRLKSFASRPPKGKFSAQKFGSRVGMLLAGKGSPVSQKGDSGRGRGRPHGTFKTRYVPGVGAVKVPTSVYKKMISQAKSQARLQEAIRKQRLATPMPGDPRMQGDAQMDAFLAGEDTGESLAMQDAFARQQALGQAQEPSQQGPTTMQRLSMLARRFNQGPQRQAQQGFGFGAGGGGLFDGAGQMRQPQGVQSGLKSEPRVRALGQAEILKQPSTIGFRR